MASSVSSTYQVASGPIFAGRQRSGFSGSTLLGGVSAGGSLRQGGFSTAAASLGGVVANGALVGNVPRFDWINTNAGVVCCGNSLMKRLGGQSPPDYMPDRIPITYRGTPITNTAIGGSTSVDMLTNQRAAVASAAATYAAAGRQVFLLSMELTNSILKGRTPQQAVDDYFAWIAAARADATYKGVAAITAIPAYYWLIGDGAPINDTKSAAANAAIDAANALLRAQYSTGNGNTAGACDILIDLRAPGSPFDFGGDYTAAKFIACQDSGGNALYENESGTYLHTNPFGCREIGYQFDAGLLLMPA